jgi:hypothetical protein
MYEKSCPNLMIFIPISIEEHKIEDFLCYLQQNSCRSFPKMNFSSTNPYEIQKLF